MNVMKKKSDSELLRDEFYLKSGVLYRTKNDQEVLATPSKTRKYRYVGSKSLQQSILYGRVVFLLSRGYLPRYVYYVDGDKTNCEPSNLTDKRTECLTLTA